MIPTIPLEENRFVTDTKEGLFDPAFIAERSTWRRATRASVIDARSSGKKLEALGFDPIETMVRKFDEIQTVIDQIMLSPKPSMIALASLYTLQQKISNDLMKYGYNTVPDRKPDDDNDDEPCRIVLEE